MKKILFVLVFVLFVSFNVEAKRKESNHNSNIKSFVNYLLEGNFKKASKTVKSIEKKIKKLDDKKRNFILGYVQYKLERYKEAEGYFSKSVGLDPVPDYPLFFLGKSALNIGSYKVAAGSFQKLIDSYPESIYHDESLWNLAKSEYGLKNYSKARDVASKLDMEKVDFITYTDYDLFKASLLVAEGKSSEAVSLLETIYFTAVSKDSMNEALKMIKEMNSPEAKYFLKNLKSTSSQLRLAEGLMRSYRYDEGLAILNKLYNDKDPHMMEVLANAYFKSRNYPEAKKLYEKLLKTKQGRGSGHYMFRLAKSAARSDDFETAIRIYKSLLKGSKANSKYIYKLGFLYLDSNRYKEALKYFNDLQESGYRGHLKKKIDWYIGWCHYKLGQYSDAIASFQKFVDGYDKDLKIRAKYWIARSYDQLGQGSLAKQIYQEVLSKAKFNYYGFVSAEKLGVRNSIPKNWIDFGDDAPLPEIDISNLPSGLNRAVFFYNLGLTEFARQEFIKFERKNLASSDEALAYMKFSSECGDYRDAHLTAIERFKNLLYLYPASKGLRFFVWENWYPEAYKALVDFNSKDFEIEDDLAYSIMREESRFQSNVVSKADAIGLMQIIPPTGAKLAKALDYKDFTATDLYKPEVNIRFGTKYLGDLLKLFNGEKVYVIGSYNAGEDAVGRWVKNSDAKDIEEFIEEIPYDETNKYVKRVLKTYWVYSDMY